MLLVSVKESPKSHSPVKYPCMHGWRLALAWARCGEGEKVAKASDCSVRQDRAGAVSGLNPGPPSAGSSRTVQADVATSRGWSVEIGLGQQVVTERFQ